MALTNLTFTGIIIGAATFLSIGLCHPLVIKVEYLWGKKCWWVFLLIGIIFSLCSIFVGNYIISSILGALAFSFFWGIREMFQQERRVLKGWFPENPKRHNYYEAKRKELKL